MRNDFRLGEWLVQPSLGRISRDGQTVQVRAKVMDLLVYLARRPGEVIPKDVLLDAVWGIESISESAITRTITELRQVLGDDAERPTVLETIPKRGYRLIAPVVAETVVTQASIKTDKPASGRRLLAGVASLVLAAVVWIALAGRGHPPLAMHSRPVTALDGVATDPSLSPGGDQIAFIWNNNLYVKGVDSGEPRRVADNVVRTAWSHDGQWIATYRDLDQAHHHELLLVSPNGGAEQRIGTFHATSKSVDWSPDGRWIALSHIGETNLHSIVVVSVKTGDIRTLSAPPPDANYDARPKFSNDGRRVAFLRHFNPQGTGKFEVIVVDVDGKNTTTVRTLDGRGADVDWTPDDRALVVAMQTPYSLTGLWRVPLDAGSVSPLEVGENARRFSISGSRLAYSQLSMNQQLWVSSGPGSVSRPFREISRQEYHPQFSPDGRRVAFVSSKTRDAELWICNVDGTGCGQRTHTGGVSTPQWSPDGTHLIFASLKEDGEIYIIGANSGAPRGLAPHPAPDAGPGFSFNGEWVYFNSRRSGAWGIWRVPARGGTPEYVGGPGVDVRFSADGWLYFHRLRANAVGRVRPDGSDEQILVDDVRERKAWTLVGNVLFVRRGDVVYKFDASSRRLVELQRLDRGAQCEGFDVSPDGKTIVYCAGQPQGDIILVENFR